MGQIDLSLPDPTDPTNLDPVDRLEPPPNSNLQRHPYVRRLLREIAALRETVQARSDLQREMVNRSLVVGRALEPLNPAPPGLILPVAGLPTIVHVDNLRLLANRVRGESAPTIRILAGGPDAAPQHCHWVRLGVSELRESATPLPNRSAAFVVLYTDAPVEVLR